MSTFYAAFKDASTALRLTYQILDAGALSDDVSVLAHERHKELHSIGTTPIRGDTSVEMNDDISSVSESDEGQEIAERDAFDTFTQGQRDSLDLFETNQTGFPSEESLDAVEESTDEILDSIVIPGFGIVLGGGSLATAALATAKSGPGQMPIQRHYKEEGVDTETADLLLKTFHDGGVVVAVELTGGSDQAIRLEGAAESFGAVVAATFGAPRYTMQDVSRS